MSSVPPQKPQPARPKRIFHCSRCGLTGHTRPRCTANFILAAKQNQLHIVSKMMKAREDVNQVDPEGYTALMWAAQLGNLGLIKLLLRRRDIDVNKRTVQIGTALLLGVLKNRPEVVKELLGRQGVDVNLPTANSGYTPLMVAARMNLVPIARLLLRHPGIDVHLKDAQEKTALKFANDHNAPEIADLISSFIDHEIEECQKIQYCKHLHEQYGRNACPICLERMIIGGDPVCIAGDCGHPMHLRCLQKWERNTCPVCRKRTTRLGDQKGVRIFAKYRAERIKSPWHH